MPNSAADRGSRRQRRASGCANVGGRNKAAPPFETAETHKEGVYVFGPQGKLLSFAPIPRDEVTNCAFGGKDLKTLYVAAGGTLWSIRTNAAGRAVWP